MLVFYVNKEVTSLSTYDTDTKKTTIYRDDDLEPGLMTLFGAKQVCGHDAISGQLPRVKAKFPWFETQGTVLDTYIIAKLAFPDLLDSDEKLVRSALIGRHELGSHELTVWAKRLEYWGDGPGELMTTVTLLAHLKAQGVPPEVIKLEHKVATIIQRQVARGVHFDLEGARHLYVELMGQCDWLEARLRELVPPGYESDGEFVPQSDNARLGFTAGAKLTRLKKGAFNPMARHQIAAHLIRKYGHVFEYTPTGEAKVDEAVLQSLPMEWPEVPLLVRYWTIKKRMSQLRDGNEGWLRHVSEASRIHGKVNTVGTISHRMTHTNPNLSQVPKVGKPWGAECRSLFQATPGWKLVGVDAEQLELALLAHYLAAFDQGSYARTIEEGDKELGTDSHSLVAKLAGLPTRDDGKTLTYKLIYGGRAEPEVERTFFQRMPAFKQLMDAVKARGTANGFLNALDGRKVMSRKAYTLLNQLLQSAGAIVMKHALVILDDELQLKGLRPGVDYEFALNVHDEFQIDCVDALVKGKHVPTFVAQVATWSIAEAGRRLKLRVKLKAKAATGLTWAETH